MDNNKNELKSILNSLRPCLKGLGIKVINEEIDKDACRVNSAIGCTGLPLSMQLAYRKGSEVIALLITSPTSKKIVNLPAISRFLNEINRWVMDIGHFCVDPSVGNICFVAAVARVDQGFCRKEIIRTIDWLSSQACSLFELLHIILESKNQCPLQTLSQFTAYLRQEYDNHSFTKH